MRFEVQHAPGGEGARSYGVWDNVADRWRSSVLTRPGAAEFAFELNIEYGHDGLRPRAEVRRVQPPRRVEVKVIQWREGDLSCWVREPDGWYGHAKIDGFEAPDWYPSDRLRPTTLG